MVSFNYIFVKGQPFPDDVILQGDAKKLSDNYLRLIGTDADGDHPQANSVGRAVRTTPIVIRKGTLQADFETTLTFRVTPYRTHIPAAGLAFFIAPANSDIPDKSFGEYYGVFDPAKDTTPHVFAVVFDTRKHDSDPYYKHVAINIESIFPAQSTQVGSWLIGNEVTAKISYKAATKKITAQVSSGQEKSEVSYVYDLSTVLNESVWVGLSGTTGDRVASHDVYSWNFTSTDV